MLDLFAYTFVMRALIAGSFVAALAGMLGLILVLKKWSLIGDGLGHVSFGAIALGLLLGWEPITIAVPVSIVASFAVWKLSEKATLYGDAAIGVVSAAGVATGVILASVGRGFNVDLFSYLFGNILAIGTFELWLSVGLSAVVAATVALLYHDLFAVTFDDAYATIAGVNTNLVQSILMTLTAVVVVLAVKLVGVILVSALLIIPAITALQLARGFRSAMLVSVGVAVLSVITGVVLSFYADIPAGATIVLLMIGIFLFALGWKKTA